MAPAAWPRLRHVWWRDPSVCLQGMRVVNIVGFRRGYNFLNELLALAKPFGKVVKHLVLDLRAEVGFRSVCFLRCFHGN